MVISYEERRYQIGITDEVVTKISKVVYMNKQSFQVTTLQLHTSIKVNMKSWLMEVKQSAMFVFIRHHKF